MKALNRIFLFVGILLLLNLLSRDYFFRLDLTKDKQYTLSKATTTILENLEEPITVTAYFSEDLPSQIVKTREDFRDLLIEYSTRSRGLVDFEFQDPGNDPVKIQEAQQNGISPITVQVRERDEASSKDVYLGAVIKSENGQEILPLIQPEGPMEYQLTTSIKKIAELDKPVVGLVQGHGEPTLQDLPLIYQSLSILYNVEPLELESQTEVPARFKSLLMINPADTIPMDHFDKLDDYLEKGGNLCVAFNAVQGDFQTAQGTEFYTGMSDWLGEKSINVQPNFIIDPRCGEIQVQRRQGMFTFNTPVKFPYFPRISEFQDHPITDGLDQITFQFASPITFQPDSSSTFQPLILTSEQTGNQNVPLVFDVQKEWSNSDFQNGQQTIGGILTTRYPLGSESNIILFTDGDFPIGSQGRGQNPDNVSLISNSMDWLSDDTGLIDLRTKGVATRPLKELEDSERSQIKWLNFLLPVFLVIVYGLYRTQRNRRIRMNRMEEQIS